MLPRNVKPFRSLADCGYTSDENLQLVRDSQATPYHGLKKNAIHSAHPINAYQKLVYSATHFQERFKEIYGMRSLVETVFSMIDAHFGYRIRCRSTTGRENEVHAKINAHNLRMICLRFFLSKLV